MVLRRRNSSSPQWPFWLLLSAWFCASCPQIAIFTVVTWMAESRSFAHQQRLSFDVAHLLSGEQPSRPISEAVARAQEKLPTQPTLPVTANAAMQKIELSLEKTSEFLPVALRADRCNDVGWLCPEARRSAPPHGPPRLSVV